MKFIELEKINKKKYLSDVVLFSLKSSRDSKEFKSRSMRYKSAMKRMNDLNKSEYHSEKQFELMFKDFNNDITLFKNYPILGRFFADFYDDKNKILIEVDGLSHKKFESIEYDKKRDASCSQCGYKVLRLRTEDKNNWKQIVTDYYSKLGKPKIIVIRKQNKVDKKKQRRSLKIKKELKKLTKEHMRDFLKSQEYEINRIKKVY